MNPWAFQLGPYAVAWDDWSFVAGYRRVWWRLWVVTERRT